MHAQPHSPVRGNWIWLVSAAAAVTVLTVTGLSVGGPGDCRSPAGVRSPTSPTPTPAGAAAGSAASPCPVLSGLALYYSPGDAVGSCSLGPFPAGGLYASLPPGRYAHGAACGSYLTVRGPKGAVLAEVVDLCPGCAATTVNLSEAAFDRIADPGPGSARVTYQQARDPRLPGPIVIHVATTPGLIAVQIVNHGNPLGSVAIAEDPRAPAAAATAARASSARPGTVWHPLMIGPNDFWVSTADLGAGPFALRIIDDQGHRVTLRRLSLTAGATIRGHAWMYRVSADAASGRATGAARSAPPRTAATCAGRAAAGGFRSA